MVGVLWGALHFLVNLWASSSSSGTLSLSLSLPAILFDLLVGVLPAYRMLMVRVYDRTGSLLVAMLMHASLTACTLILGPVGISRLALLTYDLVLAAVLWVVVAAVAVANGGQLSQQPAQHEGLTPKTTDHGRPPPTMTDRVSECFAVSQDE